MTAASRRWWVGVDPVGSPLGFGWRLYWREHWCSLLFWVEVRIQIHFGVGVLAAACLSPTFVVFPYCLAALFLFLIWFKFTVVFLLFCWRLHSLCDVSALGGWRVIANWTLPPSGRMRHRVAGIKSGRPHTGIAVGLLVLTRSTDVIFPVGHRYYQALDVTGCVTHAIRCLFEYFDVLEIPVFQVLSLCFLLWGSGFMSPPCIRCFINR